MWQPHIIIGIITFTFKDRTDDETVCFMSAIVEPDCQLPLQHLSMMIHVNNTRVNVVVYSTEAWTFSLH